MQSRYILATSIRLAIMWTYVGAAPAAQEAWRHIQLHAEVGRTIRIRGHVNYQPCGTAIPTTIVVLQFPTHGTLVIRNEIVSSDTPELGKNGKCHGSSGMGRVVYYARTREGPDIFKYDSTSLNGVVHVDVTVN
jgi:hypothetical protein